MKAIHIDIIDAFRHLLVAYVCLEECGGSWMKHASFRAQSTSSILCLAFMHRIPNNPLISALFRSLKEESIMKLANYHSSRNSNERIY